MEHNCERHTFEVADGMCRSCLGSFCVDCLLYPFGPKEEPYCKPCAIAAGGIRSTAGNTRRQVATRSKAKGRSGGLLSRLRRTSEPTEEERELTREELIEIEAAEARGLLDAQRLPSEPDEEPEPELPPTPNIAPPGGFDEESELAHRTMPDEIAGGLDLSNADDDAAAPAPTADHDTDTPAWARPQAAETGPQPDPAPAPAAETGPQPDPAAAPAADGGTDTPAWARPEAAESPSATGETAPGSGSTRQPDPPDAVPAQPPPSPVESPPTPAGDARTADGTALFAQASPAPADDLLERVAAVTRGAASSPSAQPVPAAAPDGADAEDTDGGSDTDDLLRRIADLGKP
jgi:hypothetical protein